MMRNLFWLAMDDAPIKLCLSTSPQASLSTGDCNLKTNTALITNPLNQFPKSPTITKYYHKNLMFNSNTRANQITKASFLLILWSTPKSLSHCHKTDAIRLCSWQHIQIWFGTLVCLAPWTISPHVHQMHLPALYLQVFLQHHSSIFQPPNTKHSAPHQRTKAFVL